MTETWALIGARIRTLYGTERGVKYHGGVGRRFSGGKEKRSEPLTCRDPERRVCPEGDLNPHAR